MKKILYLFMFVLLFVSCNASILMNNGEMEKPQKIEREEKKEYFFSTCGASQISATKSYYKDRIVVRWSSIDGADFYSLEKAESEKEETDSSNLNWKRIVETIEDTCYIDKEELKSGKYYYYRVTAHTYYGKNGEASKMAVGTILSSPSDVTVSKGTSIKNIEIEWNQMPYVESYRIYKSQLSNISGLESEYIATIEASHDSEELVYTYEVDEKEMGKEIYFALQGVGPTEEKADVCLPRSGYTLVPGAPKTPEVLDITKGDDKESITIQIKKDSNDEVDLIIKRYSLGSSETVVYSGEYGEKLEADENGIIYFVDKNVKSGVEYTYSITAYNSIGQSAAVDLLGYLLSPVKEVSLLPIIRENGEMGYELTFKENVGFGDQERKEKFVYNISSYNKKGDLMDEREYEEGSFSSLFYPVKKTVTKESEMNEIYFATVSVSLGSLVSETKYSEKTEMMDSPIAAITATKNEKRKDGEVPNSNGVYPVTVTWSADENTERTIKRIGSDGSEKEFKVSSGFSLIDNTTLPLVTYDYFIDTSDVFGRSLGEIKHTGPSYASLDKTVLINIMESVALKPFDKQEYVPDEYKSYWKNSEIAKMVSYGNASDLSTQMKALGSASDKDHFRGGTISYKAEMEGMGGAIYFSYSSFGENKDMFLDGQYEMHVNASGTGNASSSTGGLNVGGMYPAHISLEKISVSKKAFAGSYIVTIYYSDGDESYEVEV